MKPYYENEHGKLYCGDCLEVLPALIAEGVKVDGIITDPPYSSGGRQQASARNIFAKADDVDEETRSDEWFLGDNMGSDTYIRWMRQIARCCFEIATSGTSAFVFTDWRQYTNVTTAWESLRWTLRSVISWDKAKGGALGSFWRNNHEWIPIFVKGKPRPLPNGSFFNTWTGTKPQGGEHPTEKPLALMEYICRSVTGDNPIIDPFAGSGTTLVAAQSLGRKWIGIEISPDYCEIAKKRLEGTIRQIEGQVSFFDATGGRE